MREEHSHSIWGREIYDNDNLIEELHNRNNAIILQNVSKVFNIGEYTVRAVYDASLSIKKGELISIKGPSGAGKTTLLNLIGGLDSPSEGVIYNYGVKISELDQEELSSFRLINSGFIFQSYNLIDTLTAAENILILLRAAGTELKEARRRMLDLLERVNLVERREHFPYELSSGEQQRIAIARALANDSPVLLVDEPTANLDEKTGKFIRDFFIELGKEKKTIIVATHDEELIKNSDRVITFSKGKIIKME